VPPLSGVSNLFTGILTRGGPEGHILTTDGGLQLLCPLSHHPGGKATLIIRPEKVLLNPSLPSVNSFPGRIARMKYLGSSIEYHIALPSGEQVIVRKQITENQEVMHWIDEEIMVQLPPSSLCLVEETGGGEAQS
jgi:ABC-type Fe3+/spermidine/putrescine transport system ATPase subunit